MGGLGGSKLRCIAPGGHYEDQLHLVRMSK